MERRNLAATVVTAVLAANAAAGEPRVTVTEKLAVPVL